MRRFHSWTPGALWTPPSKFYQVNYKRELLRVCGQVTKSLPSLEIGLNLEAFVREWANSRSKSNAVRLERCALPQIVKPRLAVYSPLLVAVYEQKHIAPIMNAYNRLPIPRPKFIHGHVLDAMLVKLQQKTTGHAYRKLVDDMIREQYPITASERAFYILSLARGFLHDKNHACRLVTTKMLSWTQQLDTNENYALNMLLEAGLLLELPQLQDFALSRLQGGDSHTARILLGFNKIEPINVLKTHFVPPALLKSVVRRMLPSNASGAHDILAYITALKNTRAKSMSSEEESFCLKALQFIEWGCAEAQFAQPAALPQVPSHGLFQEFLDFYTSTGNFAQVRRLLVEMANHGCFPSESAILRVLDMAASSDQLDLLVHYLCDVSLYHKIMTLNLAKRICEVYRQFDERVASELQTFLESIVKQQPELIPVESLTLTAPSLS